MVYVGDSIQADSKAEAVLQTADAGLVAVRPGAKFVTESFAAEGRGSDHLRLRIGSGSLRLVSGWIGSLNRDGVEVLTPDARIGIRGTDHEPYVLPEDLADATPFETGSYDKVNRGRTLLATAAGEIELRAGQVGFAPPPAPERARTSESPESKPVVHRGLLSLLMPALLDRVPDLYVAGRFEQDIDTYSQEADARAQVLLQQKQARHEASDQQLCPPLESATADYPAVARDWVARLDAGLLAHDASALLELFDPNAVIEATVINSRGTATSRFDRTQFANSIGAATATLENYQQQRETLDARAEPVGFENVSRVRVKSHVVEQGRLQGRDFRVESDEDYLLEARDGHWLAVSAVTRQR